MAIDRLVGAVLAAALAWGCTAAWDVGALESRTPALAALGDHRLGDATPYLLPRADELVLFLCRFPSGGRVRVALPGSASEEERALLRRALAAWSDADLGLALVEAASGEPAEIRIRIGGAARGFAAQTAAECGLAGLRARDGVLPARLLGAEIALRRDDLDVRGHVVPLSPEELLGSAMHELGHALGFQGHVRRGDSVMVRNVEAVRRIGHRLLAGQRFADATLVALYRSPSGVVVGRRPLPAGRSAPFDRLSAIAVAGGFRGPSVRVGDRGARISWWDAQERRLALYLPELAAVLADPGDLRLEPDPHAAAWLRAGRTR
jgi:hypothetical protein